VVIPDDDPDELRRHVEGILDRPEFGEPGRSLIERGFSWILDRIGDLFGGLTSGDVGSILVLLVVIGVIVALIAMARRQSVPLGPAVTAGREESRSSISADPELWRQRADAARAAEDWPEAVRCEHRHLAALLDRAALLRERDHRTASELLADVMSRPDVAGGLSDVTRSFEGVWYGSDIADRRLADAVREVAHRVAVTAGARK